MATLIRGLRREAARENRRLNGIFKTDKGSSRVEKLSSSTDKLAKRSNHPATASKNSRFGP